MSLKIEVPVDELAHTRKVMVAAPMYGGQCMGMFTRSMIELSTIFSRMGIEWEPYFLFNESLITRARNYCADHFMRSDCTHLMFIDSDIGFNANDVVALLALQQTTPVRSKYEALVEDRRARATEELPADYLDQLFADAQARYDACEYDIIGGPYPKKCISWEKIKLAVDKGFADEDPNNLENFVGDYVFNPKNGGSIPIGQPVEVLEIGTGFMMIRRETLVKMNDVYPELLYKPDHVRTAEFDGSRKIMMYFQAAIDPKSERYLSEDYWFCQKVQEAGLKTWFCPWMKMFHVGTYIFGGSLADIAQLGASATADPSALKKKPAKK